MKKYKFILISLIFFIVVVFTFPELVKYLGYRLNTTKSMPRGIYKIETNSNIKTGDIVEICLPDEKAKIGIARGYIGDGSCPNNTTPLAKKVIAVPNDHVFMDAKGITVNEKFYDYPQITVDGWGREIPHYNLNEKISGYFVVGVTDKMSWDSRYFGVIPRENIEGVLTPKYTES